MKKYSQGIRLNIYLGIILLFFVGSCSNAIKQKEYKIWGWIHGGNNQTIEYWDSIFHKCSENSINALLISGGKEVIERVVPISKKYHIEVHAWIWITNKPNQELMKLHPDWYMVNRNGESCTSKPPYVDYYRWLCPSRAEVREYLAQEVIDLCTIQDLKGIHFDYVRYPDVILPITLQPKYNLVQDKEYPEFDYCYCDVCRAKFKELAGVDPLEIPDPSQNKEWINYRYNTITNLVNYLVEIIHSNSKEATAAVFPTPEIARTLVRQNWIEWNIDAFLPMVYHNFYDKDIEWIGQSTRTGISSIKSNQQYYTGLFVPSLSPSDLELAINESINNGAKGVSCFSIESLTEEHWNILKKFGRRR